MSAADHAIQAMQERPLDFVMDEFTLTDRATGIKYWIANGFWFYGMYRPNEFNFTLLGQWKFARALNQWRTDWIAWKNREALAKPRAAESHQ